MIASVAFRNFKALRSTSLKLMPFNLILGPNGSGKTSLIQALLQLRSLAALPSNSAEVDVVRLNSPEMRFGFLPPYENVEVRLECADDDVCDALRVFPPEAPAWPALRGMISRIRNYQFSHAAMGTNTTRVAGADLMSDGSNLAAVLADMQTNAPAAFAAFSTEVLRLFPEFSKLSLVVHSDGRVGVGMELGEGKTIEANELSQGMLFTLGVLVLAFAPNPPSVVCIEELDRGIHPRMLREVRDALYRLSYPSDFGVERAPVQVIATTHSPYLLDLFRDHPEEVVLSQKHGRDAHFERLADRADLTTLLEDAPLGDLWFSGILGAVPERE